MDLSKIIAGTALDEEGFKSIFLEMNKHGVNSVPNSATVTNTSHQKLYDTVIKFMKEHDITCEETIHQTDRVIEDAYELLGDLFNIVKDDLDIEEDEQ